MIGDHAIGPRLALVVVAAVGLSVMAGAPAAGRGTPLACGDTITSDTTLHVDLSNCPNNGLVIDADNVTLDLNGHLLDGDGVADSSCDPHTAFCDIGIVVGGHRGVVIRGGSIRQFDIGVGMLDVHASRVVDISSVRNQTAGLLIVSSGHLVIRRCAGNRTRDSEVGEGIGLFYSRHIRVLHSSFRRNAHVGIKPIHSTDSLVKGNVIADNGDEALLMEGGSGFRVRRNRAVRNGSGITLGPGSHNVITRNRVVGGDDGIRVESGHGNLVARNLVRRTRSAGIRLGISHPLVGGSHNVVRRNRVRGSRGDGFAVGSQDRHSRLTRNLARGSGDDGFDIASAITRLTRNRAVRNADLGIEAVKGVIDGGGNVAFGSGDPRECVNVACNS